LTYPSCGLGCAEELGRLMEQNAGSLAGLVFEPSVMGAAGMIVQPESYVRRLRELCDTHGVLMIADEVATGFGRTGSMFACGREGVSPDILCVAKGITGGYLPLAATMTTGRIYEAFLGGYEELKTFFHGHTYTANPLACAASLASLDLFDKDNTLGGMEEKSGLLRDGLESIARLPHVGDVRRKGYMVGIELVKDKATKVPYPLAEKRGIRATLEARKLGAIIRPLGPVVVLMPPLSISKAELGMLLRIVEKAIVKATAV